MPTRPRRLTTMARRLTMTGRNSHRTSRTVHRTTIAITTDRPILMRNTARPAPITGPLTGLEATVLHHITGHTGEGMDMSNTTVLPIRTSIRPWGCTACTGAATDPVGLGLGLGLGDLVQEGRRRTCVEAGRGTSMRCSRRTFGTRVSGSRILIAMR